MPKSKRAKVVQLGGAKSPKSREWKEGLVARCRQHVDNFRYAYVFKNQNLKSAQFLQIRESLKPESRIQMGPVKVMKVALGRTPEEEYQEGLHKLAERMKGPVGLLFTDFDKEQIEEVVQKYQFENFPKVGSCAKWNFTIPQGPVYGADGELLPHTQESYLRQNGVPTKLNKGVVECLTDYTVCQEGKTLDHKQVAILRIFDQKMYNSSLLIIAQWDKETGEYTSIIEDEDLPEDDMNQSQIGDDEFEIDAMEAMEEGMKMPESMMLPAGVH
eukprot:TRINITY_DN9018_c0_g2_i1.p2 TRINITY_DN9018_c0_g2~~TRINITY_DN9018_c0_g2_i1.p2  ORF type:complete len:282 (-),score=31.46 TRINITY_DN9018_c0_g2_i1:834-1649(-)